MRLQISRHAMNVGALYPDARFSGSGRFAEDPLPEEIDDDLGDDDFSDDDFEDSVEPEDWSLEEDFRRLLDAR